MRILHVTDTYAPTVGGIEALVAGLARAQLRDGHRVAVLTLTPGSAIGSGTGGSYPRGASAGPEVSRCPADLERLVAAADVVHAHLSAHSPLALRAAVRAAATGMPVLATVHSVWGRGWPLLGAWARAHGGRRLPIQWAGVSGVAAGFVARALDPVAPVLVVPNAIDVATWAPPVLAPPEPPDTPLTIVSTLRMTSRKRGLPLLRMLRAVRASTPAAIPLRAVLIGDGPQLPRLRRLAARDLPWVELPGALPPERIRAVYAGAHVYAAPAVLESFGIAALEARAHGLPVVAMARSGLADVLVHDVDGLLVDGDAAMTTAIRSLVTDPDRRRAMAGHNRAVPPAADWSTVLRRVHDAYARAAVLAGRPVVLAGSGPHPAADPAARSDHTPAPVPALMG